MAYKTFKIFPVVKAAYLFAAKERGYLLKIGVVPMVVHIATALFLQFYRADASMLESYIWSLPSAALFAMYTFAIARLLLVGERLDRLSLEDAYKNDRPSMMKASVILSLLFHMGLALVTTILMFVVSSKDVSGISNLLLTIGAALIVGFTFWSVRLGVLPILASVGYPLRKFLKQVSSPLFSFQLIVMGMVAMLPIVMIFQFAMSMVISPPEGMPVELIAITTKEHVAIILISAPFSLLSNVLLNASAAFALKEILGTSSKEGLS